MGGVHIVVECVPSVELFAYLLSDMIAGEVAEDESGELYILYGLIDGYDVIDGEGCELYLDGMIDFLFTVPDGEFEFLLWCDEGEIGAEFDEFEGSEVPVHEHVGVDVVSVAL